MLTPIFRPRPLFMGWTIACMGALAVMLSHRSDEAVVFGRYSVGLFVAITTFLVGYAATAHLYFSGWRRFGQTYALVATNLLSIILLLVAINVAAHLLTATGEAILSSSDAATAARQERLHAQLLGFNEDDYRTFRGEYARRNNWQYEPWVGFKETPREGKYIDVSTEGFRRTAGSPSDPAHWIYLLGGSTTFGYGVADDQTIASYLQERLSQRYGANTFGVRNYGRAYYFSSQEFVLLWSLLRGGHRPSVVVFTDGANELRKQPYYVDQMREMFNRHQDAGNASLRKLVSDLAVQAPIYPYMRRLMGASANIAGADRVRPDTPATEIYAQYEAANEAIGLLSTRAGVLPFFVMQPLPGYRNEYATHAFMNAPVPRRLLEVLQLMEASAAAHPNRVNLTGLLDGYHKQPFVDPLHYTPEVHRLIAIAIADRLAPTLASIARSESGD